MHHYLCIFPASSRLCFHRPLKNSLHRVAGAGGTPLGARSCFRWKLHPSSQAWPLLSTSNRGETAIAKCGNWLNWLTELPAVCWSVIMGHLSPSPKGDFSTHPEAFRTGPPSCPVQGMLVLVQIFAWCLMASSQYLIQFCFIIMCLGIAF